MSLPPRYRHWIEPAREGAWPNPIVCVDCVSTLETGAAAIGSGVERLVSYHTAILWEGESGYVQRDEGAGTDQSGLWNTMVLLCRDYPRVLVVSYQCSRVWSLLGLWEGLENGRIRLSDSDYRDSEAAAARLRKARAALADPLRPLGGSEARSVAAVQQGYLVYEDPPNILRARIHGTNHSVTWIDVRNHGIDSLGDVMPGRDTVQCLAALVARLCHLCRVHHLTAPKATSGSQAMSAWRHHYYSGGVYVHTDGGATELEGRAYCGGRCECRRIGTVPSPVWHVDFRSHYGWVTATCPLPARLRDCHYYPGGAGPAAIANPAASIAEVTLETDEPAYPYRLDGEVVYPVGRYHTTLCGPELQDAIALGRVRTVRVVATYELDYCLRDYAQAVYALRCQEERAGNTLAAQWCKRLLVALPGKLGQLNHRWIDCPGRIAHQLWGEWHEEDEEGELQRYRSLGGIVQRDCVDGFAADSVPAVAAFVTSHGRLRLLQAIRTAGWDHVYYYDTDSLIVSDEGLARLRDSEYMRSTEMGQLTVREGPANVEIRGIKYYVESGRVVCSGLPRGNYTDMGDGVHYTLALSARDEARRGKRPEAIVITGTYPRAIEYHHGTVGPDGRVRPLVINEEGDS